MKLKWPSLPVRRELAETSPATAAVLSAGQLFVPRSQVEVGAGLKILLQYHSSECESWWSLILFTHHVISTWEDGFYIIYCNSGSKTSAHQSPAITKSSKSKKV